MGKFNFIKTDIDDVLIIEPIVYGDERGFFMETFVASEFINAGITDNFVQDNHSKSTKGVLRGLHFQKEHSQGKLVRVISGEVFDVAVDCRPGSRTFGKWIGETLSSTNKKMLYVPKGFAHGFLVLSDEAEFVYKCTDIYDRESEGGLYWDDKDIGIKWPSINCEPLLSEKDKLHKTFKEQTFDYFAKHLNAK